jgi:hypothetical protein
MNKFLYVSSRPEMVIESNGGSKLGNCYYSNGYKITSRSRIAEEQLRELRSIGFLGYGQGFYIRSQCDGKEEPAGVDVVECSEYDEQGRLLPGPAINPYSGEPYGSTEYRYYEYLVENHVDSSD